MCACGGGWVICLLSFRTSVSCDGAPTQISPDLSAFCRLFHLPLPYYLYLSFSLSLIFFVLKSLSALSGWHCRCEEASVSVCSSMLSSHLFSLALFKVRHTLDHQLYNNCTNTEGLHVEEKRQIRVWSRSLEWFYLGYMLSWAQSLSLLAVTYFCLEEYHVSVISVRQTDGCLIVLVFLKLHLLKRPAEVDSRSFWNLGPVLCCSPSHLCVCLFLLSDSWTRIWFDYCLLSNSNACPGTIKSLFYENKVIQLKDNCTVKSATLTFKTSVHREGFKVFLLHSPRLCLSKHTALFTNGLLSPSTHFFRCGVTQT